MKKQETERILTEKEQIRLDRLNSITEKLEQDGYKRTDCIIDLKKANIILTVVMIPFLIAGVGLYYLLNGIEGMFTGAKLSNMILFLVVFIVLIVIHELIHGITWAIFSKNHWKDIDFGVIWKTMNPYCTCGEPLKRNQYLLGAVMPLVVLGIIPMIIGYIVPSFSVLFIGLIMALSAGGDVMIITKLLKFKVDADEILIYDHPTEGGCVVFTR